MSAPRNDPRAVRWSVFTVGDNLEESERRSTRFSEILDYVRRADALGYWAFFFAEHHFDPHGEIADPWLLVAAAAERTRRGRIRLGPMVSNLALRHPVHVAEQALVADELSGGRVELGVGSGNVLQEHLAFGLGPDPTAAKRAIFEANLPRFRATLEGTPVPATGHPGGSVRVPVPGIPDGRRHVWVAAGRTEAAVQFAREGHPVALGPPFATMDGLAPLREQVAAIRAAVPAGARPRIAAAFPVYVGPDVARAETALTRFLLGKLRDGAAHLPPAQRPVRLGRTPAELVARDLAVIGEAPAAARQLATIADTGITDLFAIPDFGGLEPERVVASLEALARVAGLGDRSNGVVPSSAAAGGAVRARY